MIPQFPEFKKLELSDKEDIEKYTNRFPPYSDFNFVSMWSWDIKGDLRVSILNDNLIVRFNDYLTEEPFFSCIGTNEIPQTVKNLLALAPILGILPELGLIPEETAKCITEADGLLVEEDRDNFDYICDVGELKDMNGGKFKQKRNEVNFLLANYPELSAREISLSDFEIKKSVMTVFNRWIENKINEGKDFEKHEEKAFNKMLLIADQCDLVCVGIFLKEDLVAFMISEKEGGEYALGHASKADTSIKGSNSYMMKMMSEVLFGHSVRYFNYEQDLGLENLRDGKNRFRPSFFLKKYKVRTAKELSTSTEQAQNDTI